jgi:mevalonate kinase
LNDENVIASSARATAHGKLLLFGEHAAVYGYPAVGMTLPLPLSVTVEIGSIPGIHTPGLGAEASAAIGHALSLAASGPNSVSIPSGLTIRIDSTIPQGRGFGSSGALCGALARAILLLAKAPVENGDPQRAWKLAHAMEHAFHGTPSGIDTGLALGDGLILFRPKPPELPGTRALKGGPLALLAVAVPRTGTTGAIVGSLRERIRTGDPGARHAVKQLGSAAEEAARLLDDGNGEIDVDRFAALTVRAQKILADLGLSSPDIERVLDAGVRHGALGGKLSGAGGGGALYLVFRTPADLERARDALAGGAAGLPAGLPAGSPTPLPVLNEAPSYAIVWDGIAARFLLPR